MKSKFQMIIMLLTLYLSFNFVFIIEPFPNKFYESLEDPKINEYKSDFKPKSASNGNEFSCYNLSVIFDESTSSVTGNLSVNYYNNDPVNLTQIPFHLFLSGMEYLSRAGDIEILNVSTLESPRLPLTYIVDKPNQLLWVTLESQLNPYQKVLFEIEFRSVIPDGRDRANSHGSDFDQSRIYKFTSFYPMPCVYDEYDQWNIDPYLDIGDPFYHDAAIYHLFIEAPNGMVITATGELLDEINLGTTTLYHFDPLFPVREVTFSASRYFQKESTIVSSVSISTYYLPKSSYIWENDALDYAVDAYNLFDATFGTYPYSTLNVVEEYAFYGGMEYPCQVYISENIDNYQYPTYVKKQILEKGIVHEIAHQWWYNLVGFDQVDWGFLDEGLTCWSTDYYATVYHAMWTYFQFTSKYFDRVRTYYVFEFLPSRINQSAYDLIEDNLNWVYISYEKAPLIFEKISRTLGKSNFLSGLNNFFEQYKYKVAMLSDLQDILETTVSQSLDWLFFPWFDNDYIPFYKIIKCSFDESTNNLTVIIEDKNEDVNRYSYSQQVDLYVFSAEPSIIYRDTIWINSTTTLEIPLSDIPEKIRLDYGQEVIAQLGDASITYVEALVREDNGAIPGYNISILLIVGSLGIMYILYGYKKKIKSKTFII